MGAERTGMLAFRGPFPCVGSSEHAVRVESASANLGPGPDRAGPGKPTLAHLWLRGGQWPLSARVRSRELPGGTGRACLGRLLP